MGKRTWAEYVWPDWVPAALRQQIQEFWAESFHRSPDEWERNAQGEGSGCRERPWPALGDTVEGICRHGEVVVTGRYVHAWNNMGRIVESDGSVVCVSNGPTQDTVSVLWCECNERTVAPTPAPRGRPPIVCLCGSTRFIPTWNEWRRRLTEQGEIVLAIEVVTPQSATEDPQVVAPDLKARLDELHKRKIDLADYVLVLDVGGYIGESTRSEIKYARANRKPVRFLSKLAPSSDSAVAAGAK